MHLIDLAAGFAGSTAIVANSIPVSVGMALAQSYKRSNCITCVFFGDGAVEEGSFYEAANFAALQRLPVLFVCENNLYSVYSHISARQPANRRIYKLADAIGIQSGEGNGNDVECVRSMVTACVDHIRNGGGPEFMEFHTYRWREHCGPNYDNHIGYRTEKEFLAWKQNDPVRNYATKLLKDSVIDEEALIEMDNDLAREIDEAFVFAEQSAFSTLSESLSHIQTKRR